MRRTFNSILCLAACGLLAGAAVARAADVEIDSNTFGGIEARSIGPATMGGRIAAIDAVGPDPLTIYVGAAGGGVWKSTDGGTHLQAGLRRVHPVDRRHRHRSQATRTTVWVGTGESWTAQQRLGRRRRLQDAPTAATPGQPMGLENTERIARIAGRARPTRNTVWVCATGHLWDSQRGARRLQDGRRRQDLEEGALRRRRHRLLRPRRSIRRTPNDPLRRHVAVPPQAVLLLVRRPGQRPLQVAPTAARPGSSSRPGLPDGRARGASRSRSRRRGRTSSTPWSRRRRPRSSARTTAARTGGRSTTSFNVQVRPFYFARIVGRSRPTTTGLQAGPDRSASAPTAASRSTPDRLSGRRRRPQRLPRAVDQSRRTRTSCCSAPTAASTVATTAASTGTI